MKKDLLLLLCIVFLACFSVSVRAQIAGSTAVCIGGTSMLSGTPSGGTWSSSNPSVVTISVTTGVLHGHTAGMATITYTTLSGSSTAVVTVNGAPTVSPISGASGVCVGAAITLSNTSPGGIWSSSNPSAAVGSSSGIVTGVYAGVDTIRYTITTACGTAVATKTITINPLPVAGTITGATNVCVGAAITLTAGLTGGTWSASNAAATVSGGIVTGVSAGVDTIIYRITNVCGTATATMEVTIDPLPVAGTITGVSVVCEGASITLTASIPGGLWAASNPCATVAGGIVTGVAAGVDTISYTVTNICGTAIAIKTITINPLPVAVPITGADSVCNGSAITLAGAALGGTWSSSDVAIATVGSTGVVTGVMVGTGTISYLVTNSCGTDLAVHTVSVDDPAMPLVGPDEVCQFAIITLMNATPGGTWVSSNPLTAFVFGGTVVGGLLPGMATISYTVVNACGTTTATLDVTVIDCTLGTNTLTDAKDELQVFPNPNHGLFTINLVSGINEQASVVVTNVTGAKVKELSIVTNQQTTLKLDLAAGVYFVCASTYGGRYTKKIVVE